MTKTIGKKLSQFAHKICTNQKIGAKLITYEVSIGTNCLQVTSKKYGTGYLVSKCIFSYLHPQKNWNKNYCMEEFNFQDFENKNTFWELMTCTTQKNRRSRSFKQAAEKHWWKNSEAVFTAAWIGHQKLQEFALENHTSWTWAQLGQTFFTFRQTNMQLKLLSLFLVGSEANKQTPAFII